MKKTLGKVMAVLCLLSMGIFASCGTIPDRPQPDPADETTGGGSTTDDDIPSGGGSTTDDDTPSGGGSTSDDDTPSGGGSTSDDDPVTTKAKVIVLAGQSNAVGHSFSYHLTDEQIAKYSAGFDNVLIHYSLNPYSETAEQRKSNEGFETVKLGMGKYVDPSQYPDGTFGPEVGLAEYLSETYPEETFYIIKSASGGTTLHERWYSPSSVGYLGKNLENNSLYTYLLDRVDQGMAMLEEQGVEGEIVSFLWMQGENDAKDYAFDYDTLWRNFVSDVENDWAQKDYLPENGLSVVSGGITDYWTNYEKINLVKEIYAQENSKAYFVDVVNSGWMSYDKDNDDYAHLDVSAMLQLGRSFGSYVQKAIEDLGNERTVTPVTLSGDGTQESPYLVGSKADWSILCYRNYRGEDFEGKYVRLTADIGSESSPIQTSVGGVKCIFKGNFDGDGYTVYEKLNTNKALAIGLFNNVGSGAVIRNVTVRGEVSSSNSSTAYNGVGGVVGNVYSGGATVENCVNYATVTSANANAKAGGVIGKADAQTTIVNCKNYGAVTAIASEATYTGGIVAYIQAAGSVVESCENHGAVSGAQGVGGIVGLVNNGTADNLTQIKDCLNDGAVSGTIQVGGIVGRVALNRYATLENCSNTGEISGTNGTAAYLTGNVEGDEVGSVIGSIGTLANVTFTHEHDYSGTATRSNEAAGTCMTAATWDETRVCLYCSEENVQHKTGELDPDNHVGEVEGTTQPASYATAGSVTGTYSVCGHTAVNQELPAQKDVTDGTYGTESNPYTIANIADYEAFAAAVNGGNSFSGKYIKLTENIGSAQTPVTTVIGTGTGNMFAGILDGNGKTVYVQLSGTTATGVIGYCSGGTVKNLTVEGSVEVTAASVCAGGIIGWARTSLVTAENCINKATVTTTAVASPTGGIVGRSEAGVTIRNCRNEGSLSGANYAGGILGYVYGGATTIDGCTNTGAIAGNTGVGGILGLINGNAKSNVHSLTNVSNTGTVSGGTQTGGIIGRVAAGAFTEVTVSYTEAGEGLNAIGSDGNTAGTTTVTRLGA